MNFGQYKSAYARQGKNFPGEDVVTFYDKLMQNVQSQKGSGQKSWHHQATAIGECAWHLCESVYYRIWPAYWDILSNINLAIPGEHFQLPFAGFVIRLPEGALKHGSRCAQSILIADRIESFNMTCKVDGRPLVENPWPRQLVITAQWDDDTDSSLLLRYDKEKTLEDTLRGSRQHRSEKKELSEAELKERWGINETIFRVCVATACLAIGRDAVIKPDVLKKDQDKFDKAVADKDEDAQQRLQDRATRRRKQKGFTIGRGDRTSLLPRDKKTHDPSDPTGRELQFQHQRCGHLHGYHTRDGYKIKWINQLTVRADLPLDGRERKYEVK